jgi:hypothetical protein
MGHDCGLWGGPTASCAVPYLKGSTAKARTRVSRNRSDFQRRTVGLIWFCALRWVGKTPKWSLRRRQGQRYGKGMSVGSVLDSEPIRWVGPTSNTSVVHWRDAAATYGAVLSLPARSLYLEGSVTKTRTKVSKNETRRIGRAEFRFCARRWIGMILRRSCAADEGSCPGKEGRSGRFITPYPQMSRLDPKGSCAAGEAAVQAKQNRSGRFATRSRR